MHPRYHYYYFTNDIAVLELEKDIDFAQVIRSLKYLCSNHSDFQLVHDLINFFPVMFNMTAFITVSYNTNKWLTQ
jgi:hypothetical protein